MNMDNQESSHKCPYAQPQQSQQGYMPAQHANREPVPEWVPPQRMHHLFEAESQAAANAAHVAEGLQAPQLLPQSNNPPPPAPQPQFPDDSALTSGDAYTLATSALSTISTTPSWPGNEFPFFPCQRMPRPEPKIDWLEYVDGLPWLLNSEIRKEDRTCPFCWGEFGMNLVYEEEEEVNNTDSCVESEDDDKDGGEGYYAEQLIAPTLNGNLVGGMADLHVTSSDPMSPVWKHEEEAGDGYEGTEEPRSTEGQKSMRGVKEEKDKIGKKHYA
ncbi:hypothetical protein E8E11_000043, partial [Didymella keratinophila]